jgi:diguanylate cyclase (GGDEF)-like protein
MRGLANAAVEGLILCDHETIVTINDNFAHLVGIHGRPNAPTLATYFPDATTRRKILGRCSHPIEGNLRHHSGETIPVELILRPVEFSSQPHLAIAVRDLRSRRKAEQHILFLAHHDPLTELPNRASFGKRLEQEIKTTLASEKRLAVLCLDLDRFKEVNDLFGHAAGDQLLKTVAKCVSGVLDENQMLARLGGDEFAIILPDIPDPAIVGRIAENILEVLRAENEHSPTYSLVTASIGIAVCPGDATDSHALLSHADAALYRAKAEGRATYRFFEAAMGVEIHDRRLLEHDLRHAIARREMRLIYQPQQDVESGKVVGFEACCDGRMRAVATFHRPYSSRSRKRAAPFCKLANGSCVRPVQRRLTGAVR